MDFQQKAAALNALSTISIKMRGPNDWYCSNGVEIKSGGMLESGCGNGGTPEKAALALWSILVDRIKIGSYLVVNAGNSQRHACKWNGFMWEAENEEIIQAPIANKE